MSSQVSGDAWTSGAGMWSATRARYSSPSHPASAGHDPHGSICRIIAEAPKQEIADDLLGDLLSYNRTMPFFRCRLLPLSFGAIIVTTAVPVELWSPFWGNLYEPPHGLDLTLNILLYLPLGAALCRNRWVCAGGVALGLSMSIELLQMIYVERYASVWDVAANVAGSMLGALLISRFHHRGDEVEVRISLRSTIALGTLSAAFVFLMSLPGKPTSLIGWDPAAELMVGDEVTGNRPFNGDVMSVGISTRRLTRKKIRQLLRSGPDGLSKEDLLWSRKYSESADLNRPSSIPHGEILLSESDRLRLFDTLDGGDALTVLAWFRTDDLTQTGPARIFTYSRDPWRRNFTLAQEKSRLVFRLRTPATGPDGSRPEVETLNVLAVERPTFAAAAYDGQVSRVYVDGRYIGRANLQAHDRFFPYFADAGLPVSAGVCGLSLAIIGLAIFKPGRTGHALIVGPVAGGVGAAVLIGTGGTSALPEFAPWCLLVGAACGFTLSSACSDDQCSRYQKP